MIRIVLVDDHELVRTGFRLILQQQADIDVVGEAADGERGLVLLKTLKPDLALVDVHMPGVSGIEVTERVRKLKLKTRIIIGLSDWSRSPATPPSFDEGSANTRWLTRADGRSGWPIGARSIASMRAFSAAVSIARCGDAAHAHGCRPSGTDAVVIAR